jgi:hypothetical protein
MLAMFLACQQVDWSLVQLALLGGGHGQQVLLPAVQRSKESAWPLVLRLRLHRLLDLIAKDNKMLILSYTSWGWSTLR